MSDAPTPPLDAFDAFNANRALFGEPKRRQSAAGFSQNTSTTITKTASLTSTGSSKPASPVTVVVKEKEKEKASPSVAATAEPPTVPVAAIDKKLVSAASALKPVTIEKKLSAVPTNTTTEAAAPEWVKLAKAKQDLDSEVLAPVKLSAELPSSTTRIASPPPVRASATTSASASATTTTDAPLRLFNLKPTVPSPSLVAGPVSGSAGKPVASSSGNVRFAGNPNSSAAAPASSTAGRALIQSSSTPASTSPASNPTRIAGPLAPAPSGSTKQPARAPIPLSGGSPPENKKAPLRPPPPSAPAAVASKAPPRPGPPTKPLPPASALRPSSGSNSGTNAAPLARPPPPKKGPVIKPKESWQAEQARRRMEQEQQKRQKEAEKRILIQQGNLDRRVQAILLAKQDAERRLREEEESRYREQDLAWEEEEAELEREFLAKQAAHRHSILSLRQSSMDFGVDEEAFLAQQEYAAQVRLEEFRARLQEQQAEQKARFEEQQQQQRAQYEQKVLELQKRHMEEQLMLLDKQKELEARQRADAERLYAEEMRLQELALQEEERRLREMQEAQEVLMRNEEQVRSAEFQRVFMEQERIKQRLILEEEHERQRLEDEMLLKQQALREEQQQMLEEQEVAQIQHLAMVAEQERLRIIEEEKQLQALEQVRQMERELAEEELKHRKAFEEEQRHRLERLRLLRVEHSKLAGMTQAAQDDGVSSASNILSGSSAPPVHPVTGRAPPPPRPTKSVDGATLSPTSVTGSTPLRRSVTDAASAPLAPQPAALRANASFDVSSTRQPSDLALAMKLEAAFGRSEGSVKMPPAVPAGKPKLTSDPVYSTLSESTSPPSQRASMTSGKLITQDGTGYDLLPVKTPSESVKDVYAQVRKPSDSAAPPHKISTGKKAETVVDDYDYVDGDNLYETIDV